MAQFTTAEGSAYWAAYLINGDASGITAAEEALADAWLERQGPGASIVGCAEEPYFSWSYGFHTGADCQGGDLLEYTLRVDGEAG